MDQTHLGRNAHTYIYTHMTDRGKEKHMLRKGNVSNSILAKENICICIYPKILDNNNINKWSQLH